MSDQETPHDKLIRAAIDARASDRALLAEAAGRLEWVIETTGSSRIGAGVSATLAKLREASK